MPYTSFVYKWKKQYYIEYLKNIQSKAESCRTNLIEIFPKSFILEREKWREIFAVERIYREIVSENPILSECRTFDFKIEFSTMTKFTKYVDAASRL
jgi:hypothetical protein